MSRTRNNPEPVVFDRQEQVEELCLVCRQEGRFAFDTEFVMEDRYEAEVCLIQIATESSIALIDPFIETINIEPIWGLIYDQKVETVVHAGQEDFALCVQHSGRVPRNVFDVQIAVGLVGTDYPLSLQKLVHQLLHVKLHKGNTLTNWRKRPLTQGQLCYAAEDVAYLLEMKKKLHSRLEKSGRRSWANKEFERFEDKTLYLKEEEEKLARIKGSGSLSGKQLAVLHELLGWREELAQILNRPARTVLRDYLLMEITKADLSSFQEIKDLRGINLNDKHIRLMCNLIKEANEIPPEKWPAIERRNVENASETAVIALITALIRSYCLENDLAYSLVATKKSISQMIRHHTNGQPAGPSEITLMSGWRGESIGNMIHEVLEGNSSIRVESHPGKKIIKIQND